MADEITETRPQPKYALLTVEQYFKFNKKLSEIKGWEIGKHTERCFPLDPPIAKINIVYDGEGNELSYDTAIAVIVSSEDQIEHPIAVQNIELVDDYIMAENENIITILKDEVVAGMLDSTAQYIYDHAIALGFSPDFVQMKMKQKLGIE